MRTLWRTGIGALTITGSALPRDDRCNITFYTYVAPAVILLSIVAGIALRLSGFIGGAYSWFAFSATEDDSWGPMGLAFSRVAAHSPGSLYDVFFVEHSKFQYPASSLLLHSALSAIGIAPTHQVLSYIVWLSIFFIPFVIYCLCLTVFDHDDSDRSRFSGHNRHVIAISFALGSLFFYPIMISFRLGQIQGLLDLLFTLSCFLLARNRKLTAGCLIGVICLVKPQFSLILLWAVIRRQTYFATGQATILVLGSIVSVILYGLDNNIRYFEVLSYLSQHGETYWDNTSVNGFVSRIIHPDLSFSHEFPPFDMTTYVLTMASSIAIVTLGLLANRRTPYAGGLLDFMMAGLCFTRAGRPAQTASGCGTAGHARP